MDVKSINPIQIQIKDLNDSHSNQNPKKSHKKKEPLHTESPDSEPKSQSPSNENGENNQTSPLKPGEDIPLICGESAVDLINSSNHIPAPPIKLKNYKPKSTPS